MPTSPETLAETGPASEDALHALPGTWEAEVVDFYTHLAQAFSLPKSVGSIFGIIFSSPVPLSLDDIVERLGISKGSGSAGLRLLQRVGAVQSTFLPGDRRTRYLPETSLRRLLIGLLQETVAPHLRQSAQRLESLPLLLDDYPPEQREVLETRLRALTSWETKTRRLLPFVLTFLGKPLKDKATPRQREDERGEREVDPAGAG